MERYVVHVTKECNMSCVYCYEKDKVSTYTWEEVREFLDRLVANNKEKSFGIEYLGGEPLLAFDIIKKATEYLENIQSISVNDYMITTNGTILNDDIIEFMKKYPNVCWAASMDGNRYMNQLRVFKDTGINSYEVVIENAKEIIEKLGAHRVGIHMVTHPFNIGYLSKGIDHLYHIGIRRIGVGTVENTLAIGEEYASRFIQELSIVSERIANGEYPGLSVDVLESLKPEDDQRYYIKDPITGKTIGESYGRAKNDITQTNEYNSMAVSSDLSTLINYIRRRVYIIHQENIRRWRP